jgi:hypothetical protein
MKVDFFYGFHPKSEIYIYHAKFYIIAMRWKQ